MSSVGKELNPSPSRDLVLQEICGIKDQLSASYGHNVDHLFEASRKRQTVSSHRVVSFQKKSRRSPR
jgi:hypothetical protein